FFFSTDKLGRPARVESVEAAFDLAQGCCTSSFRLGRVSRSASEVGGFSVNPCRCQKQCHHLVATHPVPISVCKTDWKLCHVIPLAPPDWQCRHWKRPTLPDREPGPTAPNASASGPAIPPTTPSCAALDRPGPC